MDARDGIVEPPLIDYRLARITYITSITATNDAMLWQTGHHMRHRACSRQRGSDNPWRV